MAEWPPRWLQNAWRFIQKNIYKIVVGIGLLLVASHFLFGWP